MLRKVTGRNQLGNSNIYNWLNQKGESYFFKKAKRKKNTTQPDIMRIIVKAPEFLSEKQMAQSSLLHRKKYIFEHMKLKPLLAYVSAFSLLVKEVKNLWIWLSDTVRGCLSRNDKEDCRKIN